MVSVLFFVYLALLALAVLSGFRGSHVGIFGFGALSGWIQVIADVTVWHYLPGLSITVPIALFLTWLWWISRKWKRPKRRKASELIGEKSRALRDAVVRRMNERLIPIPVPA